MMSSTSTLYTVEWNYQPQFSTEKQRYFMNHEGRILAELITSKGNEYYMCSNAQMNYKTLGEYIGCVKSKNDAPTRTMVVDHEKETEFSFTIDCNKYL